MSDTAGGGPNDDDLTSRSRSNTTRSRSNTRASMTAEEKAEKQKDQNSDAHWYNDAANNEAWRKAWVKFIPFFGPVLMQVKYQKAPTYDAIEKTLQIFGIIGGLLLSSAFGTIGGEQPQFGNNGACGPGNNGTVCDPCPMTYFGCSLDVLYISGCFLMMEMMMVFTTYYTLTCCLNSHDEDYRDLQVEQWWALSGRYNLSIQVIMLVAGVISYWEAIAYNLAAEYPYLGNRAKNINIAFYAAFVVFAFGTNVTVVKACTEKSEEMRRELEIRKKSDENMTFAQAGATTVNMLNVAKAFKSGAQSSRGGDQVGSIQAGSSLEAALHTANPAYPEQANATRES